MPRERRGRTNCPVCGQHVPINNMDGSLRKHHDPARNGYVCKGPEKPKEG